MFTIIWYTLSGTWSSITVKAVVVHLSTLWIRTHFSLAWIICFFILKGLGNDQCYLFLFFVLILKIINDIIYKLYQQFIWYSIKDFSHNMKEQINDIWGYLLVDSLIFQVVRSVSSMKSLTCWLVLKFSIQTIAV